MLKKMGRKSHTWAPLKHRKSLTAFITLWEKKFLFISNLAAWIQIFIGSVLFVTRVFSAILNHCSLFTPPPPFTIFYTCIMSRWCRLSSMVVRTSSFCLSLKSWDFRPASCPRPFSELSQALFVSLLPRTPGWTHGFQVWPNILLVQS
jgi:hypothetical protein